MGDGKAKALDWGYLDQSLSTTSGSKYKVTFTISNYASGDVFFRFTGNSNENGTTRNANGTYNEEITLTNSQTIFRFVSEGGVMDIDNISIKEITDATDLPRLNYDNITWQDTYGSELVTNGGFDTDSNWTKGTGWSVSNGKAVVASGEDGSTLSQDVSVVGKINKVTFTISDYTGSGFVRLRTGDASQVQDFNANGTYTIYVKPTTATFSFARYMNGTLSIDNVSVKEITGQEVASSGCPSLLLEPQSTNLVTYSEGLDNWQKSSTNIITSDVISPSGQSNVKKIITNNATNQAYSNITATVTQGATYIFSCFAKKGEVRFICIVGLNPVTFSYFDLELGVKGTSTVTSKMEDYGNGWYRCSATFTADTTSKFCGIYLTPADDSLSASSIPNGDGNYIFGAQLEQQSYATSYIPTNGTVQTRLADSASRSGLQDHINSTEGVLYAEIAALSDDGTDKRIALSDGTMNNYISIGYSRFSGNIISEIISRGVLQTVNWGASGVTQTNNNKFALSWESGTMKFYVNGTQTNTENVTSPIGLNVLDFSDAVHTLHMYGKVKDLRVYKTALSDEELTNLTS